MSVPICSRCGKGDYPPKGLFWCLACLKELAKR